MQIVCIYYICLKKSIAVANLLQKTCPVLGKFSKKTLQTEQDTEELSNSQEYLLKCYRTGNLFEQWISQLNYWCLITISPNSYLVENINYWSCSLVFFSGSFSPNLRGRVAQIAHKWCFSVFLVNFPVLWNNTGSKLCAQT